MPKEHYQHEMRRSYNAWDQFDRQWLVTIEIETGDPVNMTPTFTDPLRTPYKYVKADKMRPAQLTIDFAQWETDQKNLRREWEREYHKIGMQLYGDGYNALEALKKPHRAHREAVGQGPFPAELIARAAKGDTGLLGVGPLSREDAKVLGDYAIGVTIAQDDEELVEAEA